MALLGSSNKTPHFTFSWDLSPPHLVCAHSSGRLAIAQWFLHPPPLVILRSALLTTPTPPTNTSYPISIPLPSLSHPPKCPQVTVRFSRPAPPLAAPATISLSGTAILWAPRCCPTPISEFTPLGSLHLESSRSHCVLASPVLTLEDAI